MNTRINILENDNSKVESDRNVLLMNEIVKLDEMVSLKGRRGCRRSLRKFNFLPQSVTHQPAAAAATVMEKIGQFFFDHNLFCCIFNFLFDHNTYNIMVGHNGDSNFPTLMV